MIANYINFKTEEEINQPIYRIIPCRIFEEMLIEQKNYLRKPKKWNDPFENFILNATGVLPDGEEATFSFRDSQYGQCWSLDKDSEAVWRVFCPDGKGVQLETTVNKLYKSLSEQTDTLSSFIGKVSYHKKDTLLKKGKTIYLTSDGIGIASTLLFKRIEFSYEKEIRLIYMRNNNKNAQNICWGDTISYPIVPNDLFNQVVLDPRMNDCEFQEWKMKFKELRMEETKIIQSDLYKPLKGFQVYAKEP